MSQENVDIARRMFELFNLGEIEGVAALMSPDVECFPATDELTPKGFRGREAFVAYSRELDDAFDEYVVIGDEYLDVGDCVIILGRVIGVGRVSGAEVTAEEAWLHRFREGQVVEYRECGTKENAFEAVGPSD